MLGHAPFDFSYSERKLPKMNDQILDNRQVD